MLQSNELSTKLQGFGKTIDFVLDNMKAFEIVFLLGCYKAYIGSSWTLFNP